MTQKLTTAQAFDQLNSNLLLDPAERQRARDVHNDITERLRGAGLIDGAFLQGSFKRRTMLAPLRDVDKVVLLRGDPTDTGPGTAKAAAESIAAELRLMYPNYPVTIGKHCVAVDMGEHTFAFDIVPAYDLGDDVLIINTKEDRWQKSNTRSLIEVIRTRNDVCGDDMFVKTIRAGKLYVRDTMNGCIPGLHLEAFAYTSITTNMPHDEALLALFDAGAAGLKAGGSYFDPTGVERLDTRLSSDERTPACAHFVTAGELAHEAVHQRKIGNHNAAISIWHRLLGDDFPKPDEHEAVSGLWNNRGITKVVTPAAAVIATPTRAWGS